MKAKPRDKIAGLHWIAKVYGYHLSRHRDTAGLYLPALGRSVMNFIDRLPSP